ncbi:MAG: protein-tyrosine-phosphatase [Nocardioides sp.]|nr:protein-tyrosine-phosphatase [Nocardioides sp.]
MPDPLVPLPPARTPGRYSVGLVCLGNICRSAMADVVLSDKVAEAGLDDVVEVVSCGTGGWHVGDPMDRRAAATLEQAGYDGRDHRAQQYDDALGERCDALLAMDASNLADLGGRDARDGRVGLFGDHDPLHPGSEVDDPYYGGDEGFHEVLAQVERAADAIVAALPEAMRDGGDEG